MNNNLTIEFQAVVEVFTEMVPILSKDRLKLHSVEHISSCLYAGDEAPLNVLRLVLVDEVGSEGSWLSPQELDAFQGACLRLGDNRDLRVSFYVDLSNELGGVRQFLPGFMEGEEYQCYLDSSRISLVALKRALQNHQDKQAKEPT